MITETTKKIIALKDKIGTSELADATGVRAHETIRRWVRVESHPTYDKAQIIDKLYEKNIDKKTNTNPFEQGE